MPRNDKAESGKPKLVDPVFGAASFLRGATSVMLRGGRVTKFNGIAASYAPELGLVSAGPTAEAIGGQRLATHSLARRLLQWSAAPVVLLAAQSPAFAQAQDECVELTPGNFVCQDNGDPATTTQDLGGFNATPVTVEIEDGFDIDTTGTGTDGLSVTNAEGITVNLADGANSSIIGDTIGVRLDNEDDLSINATLANVTGVTGDGVFIVNFSGAESVTLDTTAGSVSGGQDGIDTRNYGTGDTTITTGDVTGVNSGLRVANDASANDLTIDTSAGSVMATNFDPDGGIIANNAGTGNTSVTTAAVSASGEGGEGGDGVYVRNEATAGDLTVDTGAGAIVGAANGIRTRQYGTGDTTITAADVTGTGDDGIYAYQDGGGAILIDSTAGEVVGGGDGIQAVHDGSGSISVTTANVTGGTGDGIRASGAGNIDSITIDSTAGAVTGAQDGIDVRNSGTGDTTITTADVDGEAGDGLFVSPASRTADVSIDTTQGAVVGSEDGIDLDQFGLGNNTVVTGDVTGVSGSGIDITAPSRAGVTLIDTSAGTVTGGQNGIDILMGGYGTTIITADVDGEAGDGIEFDFTGEQGVDGAIAIDSSAGSVTGGENGIDVNKSGFGDVSITTADVSGAADNGISARVEVGSGDLTVDSSAGAVTGSANGIFAANYGIGDIAITTASVTGETESGIIAFNNIGARNFTIDTSAGAVSGGEDGVSATNNGRGDTTITTADVTAIGPVGLRVSNAATAGSITIDTSAGVVNANRVGVQVTSRGTGDLSITTGAVTANDGSEGTGISASIQEATTGAISVDSTAGAVIGGDRGIYALNYGSGGTSIVTADVTALYSGEAGQGVNASDRGAGDLIIDTTAGTVTGANYGIEAVNEVGGDLSITTAGVIGITDDGINAQNRTGTGNLSIDTTAGAVIGGAGGINARNSGSGDTTITTADVTGENNVGINVQNAVGTGNLTVDTTAGAVSGYEAGIDARNYGTGDTIITTANVTGTSLSGSIINTSGNGIEAAHEGSTGDLIIDTTAGAVEGRANGIEAVNEGTGDISITTADVTGLGVYEYGIDVRSRGGAGGNISVDTSAGTVTGGAIGLAALTASGFEGDVSVTTADVVGEGTVGIFVRSITGNDIIINSSAGTVTGNEEGIFVENRGTGVTSITTANVTGTTEDGINARNENASGDIAIDTSAGAVVGGQDGIDVINNAVDQSLSIVTGDVTGQTGNGILVDEYGEDGFGAADIAINSAAGTVLGASNGISVRNVGVGDLSITTASVSGTANDGIYVFNDTGDLTIDSTAGAVTGGDDGIDARNYGTGALSITTADVTGETGNGIDANNGTLDIAGGTDLFVNTSAGAVSGAAIGISAFSNGSGVVSITTGDVSGGTSAGIAIFSNAGEIEVDTTAGSVTGGAGGISVRNYGADSIAISAGDVSGASARGIYARNFGIDVIIDTSVGDVSGTTGISVENNGTGLTNITTGNVSGTTSDGIYAEGVGTDVVVNSLGGTVEGSRNGIDARNTGTGSTSITTANVTGTTDDGINAFNGDGTGDLIIDTTLGAVTGGANGISAGQIGTGAVTITTADVTGQSRFGIALSTGSNAGDVVLDSSAGTVVGGNTGITVSNFSTGTTTVITADVTGETFDGISVNDDGEQGIYGADMTIDSSAGTVSGGFNGISADNRGTGDLTITTAAVTGGTFAGISATNRTGTGNLTIDTSAGSVSGGTNGIAVTNGGTGAATITTADVTGAAGNGVDAYTGTSTTGLTIDSTAGVIVGGADGINVRSNGSDGVSITTANVTGSSGDGVFVRNTNGDAIIDTTAGDAIGDDDGIDARNDGTGDTTITAANVTAAGGDGVNITTGADSDTLDIDTSAGATVGSDRGVYANHAGSGDLTITVGNVTGQSAEGILASTTQASANILVQGGTGVDSNVIGATTGIALTSAGADITVTGLDSVTGQNGDGLNLVSNGGDITVTDIGTIAGLNGNGIFASSDAGTISVQNVGLVDGITATGGIGIAAYADNGGTINIGTSGDIGTVSGDTYGAYGSAAGGTGDVTINTSAYSVTAAIGIRADNAGAGDTTVITADVTGTAGEGISASTAGENLTVDSTAGTVTGLTDGVQANNTGTGSTAITTANVTGTVGDGINVVSEGINLTIDTSAGAVTGGVNGIYARDNSSNGFIGNDSVTTIITADVTGETGDGINVQNADFGGGLIIDTSAGSVTGGANGIAARGDGESVSITTANVTGESADGINLFNSDFGGVISVNTANGAVSGGQDGIDVVNSSGANATIATADVAGGTDGIAVRNSGAELTINSAAGTVTGGLDGINADHAGNGLLSIITAGVTADQNGIFARSQRGIDMTINSAAGAVSGGASGIDAEHGGTGTVTIITADVTGMGVDGISAVNLAQGADLIINSAAGTVTGSESGIDADNNGAGALIITSGAAVGGSGDGIAADNSAAGTDLLLNSVAGDVSGGQNGIAASNLGTGGVIITAAGATGTAGDGINAANSAAGLGITIDSSAGSVLGGTNGITASNAGSSVLLITAGDVTGTAGAGILAANTGVDTIINAGAISGGTDGVNADNATGLLSITTGDATGADGQGIAAVNTGSELIINSSAGAVTGSENGILADNQGTSILLITAADVTGQADAGIAATNAGTDLLVNAATGSITGQTDGIAAINNGTGFLSVVSGNVIGTTGDGINAVNLGSDLVVNSSAGSVSGAVNGVFADNDGSGLLTITTADVTGAADTGIFASNSSAGTDLTIDSSAGAVTGELDGIAARNTGSGAVEITTADVTAVTDQGIRVDNRGTDLIVDTTAGTVTAGDEGIELYNDGSGELSLTTANVSGAGDFGIYANNSSAGTSLTIDTGLGSISGGEVGIEADNNGSGVLSITTADVVGGTRVGINADNGFNSTDLLIDTAAGNVTAAGIGILAQQEGSGIVSITTANVTSDTANGIQATNEGGTDLLIDSSAGAVAGNNQGIRARNLGSGDTVVTTGNVIGTNSDGISAYNLASAGDISIDSSAGAVNGSTSGIFADQRGAGAITMLVDQVSGGVGIDSNATSGDTLITLGSTAVVTGTTGFGIDARSAGGDVTVQGSSGSVTGATDGIYIRPTTGDITISNIDLVEGLAGDGLDLLSQGGAINVNDVDAIIGTGGNGITANAAGGAGGVITVQNVGDTNGSLSGIAATTDGAGTIAIDVAGQTTGSQNGIAVSTEGGAVTISNSGALSGGDFAVLASGANTGAITLENSGMVGSAIQFAAADDQLFNSGTFSAQGISDFGEGDDVLINTSLITVANSAQFDRLEQLQSSGIIDLANNAVGSTFTTSGDFIGDGGQVALDVSFATGMGDLFTIGGAATGSTELVINAISGEFSFDGEVLVVDAGAGTEASAFSIADGAGSATPFLSFELGFDAAANDFSVSVNLEERVFESTKIAEAAQSLWYRSADAWADHRANSRFAGSGESPVWAVAYGISSQRNEQFSDPTGFGLDDTNLDYEQDFFGLQSGVDYGLGDSLSLGVTGGYLSSSFRQNANGSRVQFDVLNIGLSASFNAGGFFADALIKYDSISGDLSDPTPGGFSGQLDGNAFGARVDAGYRIGNDGFYVEPRVSFDFQKTDLDNLDIEGQSFEFENLNGVRGAAGLRFGGYGKTSGSTTIGYFLDASAVREFDGEADVRFRVLNEVVAFQNNPIGTYAHVEAGIMLDTAGPISGFFQVETDISQDFSSFGGKVGLKVKF